MGTENLENFVDQLGVRLEHGQIVAISTSAGRSNSSLEIGTIRNFTKTMLIIDKFPRPKPIFYDGRLSRYQPPKTTRSNYDASKVLVLRRGLTRHIEDAILEEEKAEYV